VGGMWNTRVRAVVLVVLALTTTAAVSGCGGEGGSGSDGPTVSQHITREFGHELLAEVNDAPLTGPRTPLSLLRAGHEVAMSDTAGEMVTGIDGRARQIGLLDENSWALFVNGIEIDAGPGFYELYPNDIVQWDLRDWDDELGVRATVGAFPAPFTQSTDGKGLATTVTCADDSSPACRQVKRTLRAAGVAVDGSKPKDGLAPKPEPQRGEIRVGTWRELRGGRFARQMDNDPFYSGIFADFTEDASQLRLLDWNGDPVRTEGPGTGLVGAIRPTQEDFLWLVTGVDDQGVQRAAKALNPDDLRDAYSVAITADGVDKIPLRPTSAERAKPPTNASRKRLDIDLEPYEKGPGQEPTTTLPTELPTRLVTDDIKIGHGPPMKKMGDVGVVNYVGYIIDTGKKYDTSYDRYNPGPLLVSPGRDNYIRGFEQGIIGMREGGQRLIVIPPHLAYGQKGYSNQVKPGQTIAFLVNLEEAHHY
jgi:peptidylprolyl isomerase